jgi:hypothetical protein
MKPRSERFLATIYKIWMMRHVDVPQEIAEALIAELQSGELAQTAGKKKPVRVPAVAIVNGCSAPTTLMPAGGGRYRIQLNATLRKAARADAGDAVTVELKLDRASREKPVPADLRLALKENAVAREAFEALAAGRRREFIKWFDSAKSADARIRRLGRAIDYLLQRSLSRKSKRTPSRQK